MKYLAGALIAASILLIGAAIFLFLCGGRYNVAATIPHWNITTWFLDEVRDRSIAHHSKGIQAPSLKDPEWVKAGFNHYHAMCRLCHGAPGYAPTETAQGLNPKPPNLASEEIQRRKDAEIFWIVKNGIKMTGMPAFGPTHDEEELWSIVASVKRIPANQAKEYEAMVREAERGKGEKGHYHDSKKH